jgi:hypothetical protein
MCNNSYMNNSGLVKSILFTLICIFAVRGQAAQSENELLDQLRADYAALLDARVEFEEMEEACDTSGEEQADFAAWIKQLSEQFAESCRLASSHSARSIPADIPCGEFTTAFTNPAGIDIQHETTDAEKTEAIVGQFNDSLGEFDEKLLREQDRVKAQRPLSASTSSAGGGAAGGSDGNSGGESAQASADGEAAYEGQQSDQQGSDQTVTGVRGTSSSGKQSTAPPDNPDGSDDDVVARQLREAAEKEMDPELKKKLWEEYKRYKKG